MQPAVAAIGATMPIDMGFRGVIVGAGARSRSFARPALVLLVAVTGGLADAAVSGACTRPYSDTSPWNTPVPANAGVDPASETRVRAIDGPLSSDPTQYTYPVYEVSASTPRASVSLSGWFSHVSDEGRRLVNQRGGTVRLPIPSGAAAAAGSDAQIVLLDPSTGDEWGVWRLSSSTAGWTATNGYHYNTRWSGVPPYTESGNPFVSRGAGVPYLTGLVRPCEIARGRIDHALAFAYDYPSSAFVYPATKSDGKGTGPGAMPEGTRLQLNPRLTDAEIRAWGCTGPCFTIARALQVYGMYVVDNSGRPKVMLEYEGTARWNGLVSSRTVNPIPLTAFRVLAPQPQGQRPPRCTITGTPGNDVLVGTIARDVICAGRGDDVIRGAGGGDMIAAGAGNDRIHAGRGDDRALGGPGRDAAYGGPGADRLLGERGPDLLAGGRGRDVLKGGVGRDVVFARDGLRDLVVGGWGADAARVDARLDRVYGIERRF